MFDQATADDSADVFWLTVYWHCFQIKTAFYLLFLEEMCSDFNSFLQVAARMNAQQNIALALHIWHWHKIM